jgi:hypothetical protein
VQRSCGSRAKTTSEKSPVTRSLPLCLWRAKGRRVDVALRILSNASSLATLRKIPKHR